MQVHLQLRDGTAVPIYARQKRCGGGDRNGIRKSKYAMPRRGTGAMDATARSRRAGHETGTRIAAEPGEKCDLVLSLKVAGEEAPLGSIHTLATGVREKGTAWP